MGMYNNNIFAMFNICSGERSLVMSTIEFSNALIITISTSLKIKRIIYINGIAEINNVIETFIFCKDNIE